MNTGYKKCPFCAETIKAEAIVCRFCRRDLPKVSDVTDPDNKIIKPTSSNNNSNQKSIGMRFLSLFSFKGRTGTGGYWSVVGFGIVLRFFSAVYNADDISSPLLALIFWFCFLIIFAGYIWFGAATLVKRCHDVGKSGWFALLVFIPIIGTIWTFIVLGLTAGEEGTNKYGNSPAKRKTSSAMGQAEPYEPPSMPDAYTEINDSDSTAEVPISIFNITPSANKVKNRKWNWIAPLILLAFVGIIYFIGSLINNNNLVNVIGTIMVNNQPVEGANIKLEHVGTNEYYEVKTNSQGKYNINKIPEGTYVFQSGFSVGSLKKCKSLSDFYIVTNININEPYIVILTTSDDTINLLPGKTHEIDAVLSCE